MYEGGGWYGKGVFEAGFVAEIFRTSASLCYQSIGEVLPSEHGKVSMATRWPLGRDPGVPQRGARLSTRMLKG